MTKEDKASLIACVDELFNAIPKTKREEFLGYINELYLFIEKHKVEEKEHDND